MRQQKKFGSLLRICAMALAVLWLVAFAPCCAFAASHSHLTTLENLDALGLSAYPGESAEDILLRAHAGDTRAMALAVVGYDLGLNGFPKDRMLSYCWGRTPFDWNAPVMSRFLYAYWSRYLPLSENDKLSSRGACEIGRGSPLAPFFKKAGIFDVEQRLEEILPEARPRSPEEEADYKDSLQSHYKLSKTCIEYIKRFRSGVDGVLADDEEAFQTYHLELAGHTLQLYIYYIATTHDVEKDAPDFDPERLIRYSEHRDRAKAGKSALAVSLEMMNRLSQDQEEARALIRRAHNGEAAAMRRMAVNYLGGEMGFLYSPSIAWNWYEWAAMKGDSTSMLIMAENKRLFGYHAEAWIWASLAVEYAEPGTKEKAAWMLRAIEERISEKALADARARIPEYQEMIEGGRSPEAAPGAAAPF